MASAALLFASPTTSLAADAATREAARDLGYEGVDAYQAGDYQKASERLEQAFQVLELPSIALWSARALEKTGKLLEASERYLEATRLSTEGAGEEQVQLDAQAAAAEEREALRPRIPRITVKVEGAPLDEVEVTIDGVTVVRALYSTGRPSDPGDVEIVATWGDQTVSDRVTLAEGDRKEIVLQFENRVSSAAPVPAAAAEPPSPSKTTTPDSAGVEDHPPPRGGSWQRPVGWIGVGVGAAGLVFGGVTGFLALQRNEELDESCPDRVCGPDQETEHWQYNNLRIMSSAGLIGGGVLATAGVALVLTAPKKRSSAHVSPYLGVASAGISGVF